MQNVFLIFVFIGFSTFTQLTHASGCKTLNLEIEKAGIDSQSELSTAEKTDLFEANRKLHTNQVISCAMKRKQISEEDAQAAIFKLREDYLMTEKEIQAKIQGLLKDEDENLDEIQSLRVELDTARTENRLIIRRIEGLMAGSKTRVIAGN